uniref:Uncharacterized protein n=1 Tax=Anguilla anguilla TaxID=7936 RepID=A0A0E9TLP9_ANGAN
MGVRWKSGGNVYLFTLGSC